MLTTKPRYSKEEFAQRGDQLFLTNVQPYLLNKTKESLW
jgi:hypothetical protein